MARHSSDSAAGEEAEAFEELHESPSVLLAVTKEIPAKLRPTLRRHLGFLEQQALELETGRLSVADGERIVAELRHHGREDALEAEAPTEGGMIDVIAHHGQQVDQPIREAS
jgi:hypothetical protein